jgi:4-amino-4-deoxy-L-arabinose transferase-like glycosyltransferase
MRFPPRLIAVIVATALTVGILTLHRLGEADVCGSNEAVEGVFVQQMVEHGAILFPLENGWEPMYKPPLFHWTALVLDRLAGVRKVTAFNLRLPAALYAVAGAILATAFAGVVLDADAALIAGLTLAAAYQYIEQGRIGRVDMTLCFCEALALCAFALWYAPASISDNTAGKPPNPDYRRYVCALALGLAVLAKGPAGAILPAAAIFIFLLLERRLSELWRLATPGPLILGIVVASSWYLACFFDRRYSFLNRQLGSENFGRFFGSLGAMAPWYYVKPLLLNSVPMSLIAPLAVVAALRTWPRTEANTPLGMGPSTARRPSQNPLGLWDSLRMMVLPPIDEAWTPEMIAKDVRASANARLMAIFYIVTVLFFTIAAYKRRAYLLPLWPPAAFLIGWWLTRLARKSVYGRTVRGMYVAACGILILVNFFLLPWKARRECAGDSFRTAASEINRIVGPSEPLYFYDMPSEAATLLFYLDRNAPPLTGKLGDAPPGYVIIPAAKWNELKNQALTLAPVYQSISGAYRIILLHPGKTYASGD